MDFWTLALMLWPDSNGRGLDLELAATALGVSAWTMKRWKRQGVPPWAELAAQAHRRAIPNDKAWDGFRFGSDGRLYTPFKGLSFSAADLLHLFYERQFAAMDKAAKEQLQRQLAAVRNDEERRAILEELEAVKKSLDAVQNSPLLVTGWQGQTVARTALKDNADK